VEYLIGILAVSVTTAGSLVLILFLDRFEKDPLWLLTLVFLWGAVAAGIVALAFNNRFGSSLAGVFGPEAGDAVTASTAGVVAELAKPLALLFVFFVLRRRLHGVLDGVVYGAVVGVGFAWVEDTVYVLGAAAEGGTEAVGFVFILRVFVFGLNHAFFTAVIGIGFGIAKVVWSLLQDYEYKSLGYDILHGVGRFAAVFFFAAASLAYVLHSELVSVGGDAGILVSFLVHWGGLLGLLLVVAVVWFANWRWIKKEFRGEVGLGTVGERDYRQVSRWFGRVGLELRFLFAGDLAAFFRIRKMFKMLVKLAFMKHRYNRRPFPDEGTERRIAELRERIARARC
jgi:RsiW-degrading membrane proteinase PrsW (M82 family)